MAVVYCENLVKLFGSTRPVRALDGLDLSVGEGEIFGLLGPNGSGKTTFVKCCLNIIYPSSGYLEVLGRKPGHPATTLELGYLPENPNFYDHLSGIAFLHYHAELARVPLRDRRKRVIEAIEQVHLEPSAGHRRLRTYSKGMLQRIGLAQAMIGHPKLLFLDEPQAGLDPIGRKQIKDTMRMAVNNGSTILFSSHVLVDVEDVANRVAIIDQGRVRKIAGIDELTEQENRIAIRLTPNQGSGVISDDHVMAEKLKPIVEGAGGRAIKFSRGILTCTLKSENDIPELVSSLALSGISIFEVERKRSTLEEVFLKEFGELPVDLIEDLPPGR
jgi:ABC-2 type transport system ATP-binding protein